jgi:hypothetical protein
LLPHASLEATRDAVVEVMQGLVHRARGLVTGSRRS